MRSSVTCLLAFSGVLAFVGPGMNRSQAQQICDDFDECTINAVVLTSAQSGRVVGSGGKILTSRNLPLFPQPLSFVPSVYPVGLAPTAVAVGDLDGDGHADIVVANGDNDTVNVLLGTGAGQFIDTGVVYTVGQLPIAIAIADVNGDGRGDILTAGENEDTVSVLLNTGQGVFAARIVVDTGSSPEALVVRDFDGDSHPDIATANNFDETVTIIKGYGDGYFSLAHAYVVGAAPKGLNSGDLDGDGTLDLVVTNSAGGPTANGSLTFLKGNGDGTFVRQPEFELPEVCGAIGCLPVATEIGDFNGDSKLDLAVINQDGDSVAVFLGNGDLTFRAPIVVAVASTPSAGVIADFDGDGKPDIATTASFDDFVTVLLGAGDGTFAQPLNFDVGVTPMGIAVGQLNRDSKPDVVVANVDDDTIAVLLNTTGFQPTSTPIEPSATPTRSLTPTLTSTPTRTATVVPTSTPTVSPTPSPAPARIDLGRAVARPGGLACLPASLSFTQDVTATISDMNFNPSLLMLSNCSINPAIGLGTATNKQLLRTPLGVGLERIGVFGSLNPIPPGLLYTCHFVVGAGTAIGSYSVANAPAAADPDGNAISGTTGTNGQIAVTNCAGDCDGNGAVSLGEVSRCVNLFLGQSMCSDSSPTLNCPVADADNGGSVSIGEVIQCVQRFLNGCPFSNSPTPVHTPIATPTATDTRTAMLTPSASPTVTNLPTSTATFELATSARRVAGAIHDATSVFLIVPDLLSAVLGHWPSSSAASMRSRLFTVPFACSGGGGGTMACDQDIVIGFPPTFSAPVYSVQLDSCKVSASTGATLTLNGTLTYIGNQGEVCGTIPETGTLAIQTLTIEEAGSAGTVTASFSSFTAGVTLAGSDEACHYNVIDLDVAGMIVVTAKNPQGAQISATQATFAPGTTLVITVQQYGSACVPEIYFMGVNGVVTFGNDATSFQGSFDGFTLSNDTTSGSNHVGIDGQVASACLGGAVSLHARSDLVIDAGAACPRAGEESVDHGPELSVTDLIRYSASGLELDYSDNDTIDATFNSCLDPQLFVCPTS